MTKIIKKIWRFTKGTEETHRLSGAICCGKGENVTVGKNVSFGGNVYLFGTAPISIGSDTMIAYGVIIHTSTHDYNNHPMWIKRIDRPVDVGFNVWLGAGSIVLPGVRIGDYSVVGAGSVVTSHVPEGAIVAGNPARILKYRDLKEIKKISCESFQYPDGSTIVKDTFLLENKVCKDKLHD